MMPRKLHVFLPKIFLCEIILTSETTDSYAPVSEISIPLWQEYCDRHEYEFSVRNVAESERGPVWERVRHIQENLRDFDWVADVDLDAIPTNMLIPLTEFIENKKIIVISCAPYQGYSFDVREEKVFLDVLYRDKKIYPTQEEAIMAHWKPHYSDA